MQVKLRAEAFGRQVEHSADAVAKDLRQHAQLQQAKESGRGIVTIARRIKHLLKRRPRSTFDGGREGKQVLQRARELSRQREFFLRTHGH